MRRLLPLLAVLLLAPSSAAAGGPDLDLAPRGVVGFDFGIRYSTLPHAAGMQFGAFGDVMVGPVGFGLASGWTVDRTLKKKEERQIARVDNFVHVELALSFPTVDLLAGVGPGMGWVRVPQETVRYPSHGLHQFVALFGRPKGGLATLGVRFELRQLWQPTMNDDMDFGVLLSIAGGLAPR